MAKDQVGDVSPRDVPGRRYRDDYDDEDGYERRIHAPGGSNIVTVVVPGLEGGKRGRKRDKENPGIPEVPAALPLTGNETLTIKQPVTGSPWWTRAFISILTLIRQFWPASWSWSGLNLKSDVGLTQLFAVPNRDMVYQLVYSIACKIAGAGSGTITLTINFVPLDGTSPNPITETCDLTTVGSGSTHTTPILLGAGTSVSFQAINAGAYDLGASYDLIVSAIPLCSDQNSNQADNLMI